MNLIELQIYGYGKLENVTITGLKNLQVFFGENEAGKSTIMSFIHSILFGFPTKQQTELRYEPKRHSKYGGRIKARFNGKGVAVIERVKGKAAGDVTVLLEDGSVGGDELLNELLGGMDKGTFQAIFSFNLQGLQNIHRLKGEDIGRYLFSAGALGTERLLYAENNLQKEMEQRFKPGGKKPQLNEKVKAIHLVHNALKKAEQENDEYAQLLLKKVEAENQLTFLHTNIDATEQRIYKLKELVRVLPIIIEEEQLSNKLLSIGEIPFPADGLLRIERLSEQIKPIKARLEWLSERSNALGAEAETILPDLDLLSYETELTAQLESLQNYDLLKQEQQKLQQRIEEQNDELEKANNQLHVQFNEGSILEINTSLFIREMAAEVQLKQQQLKERKHTLDENFQEEKIAIEELEKTADLLQNKLLDEQTRSRLTKQLNVFEQHEKLEAELVRIREQSAQLNSRQLSVDKQKMLDQKRQSIQMILLGMIFLALIVSGVWNDQWVMAIAGTGGLLLILTMLFRLKGARTVVKQDTTLSALTEREREIRDQLLETQGLNGAAVKEQLEKDEVHRNKYKDVAARIEQQNSRYEKVIQSFEKWEVELMELNRKQSELANGLMLPKEIGNGKIYDAFLLVERQKQLFREKSRTAERLSTLCTQEQAISSIFASLAERFLQNRNLHVLDTAVLLRKKLREEIDRQAKYREMVTKLAELEAESTYLTKELQQFTDEKKTLFQLAGVEDEEAYRRQGVKAEESRRMDNKRSDLSLQLDAVGISIDEKAMVFAGNHPGEQLEKSLLLIESHKKEQGILRDRLAETKHRMALLEEGGLYAELLHKYKQLQFEFEEEAKEWAVYGVAKELLTKTVERYRTEKLPKLLGMAEAFLHSLTDEEYIRIIPQQSGSGFIIERRDNILFEADELSQATAEQVYVSLRLALTVTLFSRYPFPIIIDDSFVNFDEKRAKKVVHLLRSISENQVLFFTCHKHLLGDFHEDEIHKLNQGSSQVRI